MSGTQITIVGNLTDEPELRFTPSGVPVVKFSVAVNRQKFNRQANAWEDAGTSFYLVSAWQHLGENIAATFTKGMRVVVLAEQEQRHWVDEATKQNRSAWELTARAAGPDLTFATADVTKSKTTRGGAQTAPDDPWASASKERPAAAAGAGRAPGAWPTGQPTTDEPQF